MEKNESKDAYSYRHRVCAAAVIALLGSIILLGLSKAPSSFHWFSTDARYKPLGPSEGLQETTEAESHALMSKVSPKKNKKRQSRWHRKPPKVPVVSNSAEAQNSVMPVYPKKGGQNNDKHKKRYRSSESGCDTSDVKTRVLIAEGCSGSTFVQEKARELMQLHGVCLHGYFEPFSNEKNLLEEQGKKTGKTVGQTLIGLIDDQRKRGHPYAFKATRPDILSFYPDTFLELKREHHAMFVYAYRSNWLDRYTCMAHDCFMNKSMGHPVRSNGQETSMCFERRFNKIKTMVWLNTSVLLNRLGHLERGISKNIEMLHESHTVHVVTEEDLTAYETSVKDEDLQRSLRAWNIFLKGWGIKPKMSLVRKALWKQQGSRPLKLHIQSIYNYKEVVEALQGSPFSKLLRMQAGKDYERKHLPDFIKASEHAMEESIQNGKDLRTFFHARADDR